MKVITVAENKIKNKGFCDGQSNFNMPTYGHKKAHDKHLKIVL